MILIKIKDDLINGEEILNVHISKENIRNHIELLILFKNEKYIHILMNDYKEACFYLEMINKSVNSAR